MPDEDLFGQVVSAIAASVPAGQLVTDLQNASLEADTDLLQAMLSGAAPVSLVRLWRRPRSLVTSRRLAQMQGFGTAAHESALQGWPVSVRQSAGLTVAHHSGVLNISCLNIMEGDGSGISLASVYDGLLRLLMASCRRVGIETDSGRVAHAYCDGSQNLRFAGRKIAGASARLIRRNGRTGLLAHACLTVHGSVEEDVAAVRRFEQALGLPADYLAGAHCSVAEALASISYPPSRSSVSAGGNGPSLRSSLGETPNFSL